MVDSDTAVRTLLRGGIVADGVAEVSKQADVLLANGRIALVGDIDSDAADETLDCEGRWVLPGLIDAHSHADAMVFDENVQLALLRQGVTSVIVGQDGISYAPGNGEWESDYFAALDGAHPTYRGGGVARLLETYDRTTPINVGYLVPAGSVRHEVMGMDDKPADDFQMEAMQSLVRQGIAEGALGLSTGLDYVPGRYASTEELARLCEPVAAAGGLYVTHMRGGYETNSASGVEEIVRIALHSGVSAHISHFHVEADEGHRILAEAAKRGVPLTFDMYPYTRGCTLVSMTLLPPRYNSVPRRQAVSWLNDKTERNRLRNEWFPKVPNYPSLGPKWADMMSISHTPSQDWKFAEGLTITEIAAKRGTDTIDAALDLLAAGRLQVSTVMSVKDQRPISNLAKLFSHPGYCGGSDGIFIGGAPHPRAYGTFAALLETYVRSTGTFTWAQAARHLAGLTAARFGLGDRGAVRPGFAADICIVDPDKVNSRSTYADPTQPAVGIEDVLVNGRHVLSNGKLINRSAGRGLRRSTMTH